MQYLRIKGANLTLAENQEWGTLHARRELQNFGETLGVLPVISIALEMSPEEMVRHADGEPLILTIVGGQWPPCNLHVGDDG